MAPVRSVMSPTLAIALLALTLPSSAHKHHSSLTEAQQNAAVDSVLWIHIWLQMLVWGVLFPTGMVLGMARSKWHVPLQVRCSRPLLLHGTLEQKRYFCRAVGLHSLSEDTSSATRTAVVPSSQAHMVSWRIFSWSLYFSNLAWAST